MSAVVSVSEARRSRVRLFIVTMLFLVTTVNYADRATLSIAGPALRERGPGHRKCLLERSAWNARTVSSS
jgi:hypothetical protein